MTNFLIRRFIKNYENTSSPGVRQAYGRLSGVTGIVLNLLLALGKLLAGLLTGAISVTADAFNNLSDAASSVVTLIGFRLAGQKPDADHPFGHGRMEYLSGLFVSVLILLVGVELIQTSFDKILHPAEVEFSWLSAGILLVSILVKLWMGLFNRKLGRAIQSAAMQATATDSLSDCVATAAVLAGLLVSHFFHLSIDGWVGLAVSAFILKAGWGAMKDTIDPLLGKPADPDLVASIEQTVLAHEEISGIHDLVIHDYGPGRRMMSLHAEVSADCDILSVHDEIDNIEKELFDTYGIQSVIHMDPVRNDEQTLQLRGKVALLVQAIDPALTIHDFRTVPGPTHTNILFDVVAPHGFRLEDDQLKVSIRQAVSVLDPSYFAVIEIDHAFTE